MLQLHVSSVKKSKDEEPLWRRPIYGSTANRYLPKLWKLVTSRQALSSFVTLKRRSSVYRCALKVVIEGLSESDTVLYDRP